MLTKGLIALFVFIIVALVVGLLGNLLLEFPAQAMQLIGKFFKDNSLIIGVIAGIGYFVWGYVPTIRRP